MDGYFCCPLFLLLLCKRLGRNGERESEIDTAKSIIYSQIDTETLCARATSAPKCVCVLLTPPPPAAAAAANIPWKRYLFPSLLK